MNALEEDPMMGSAVAQVVLQKFMDGQEVQATELAEACTLYRTSIPEVERCKEAVETVTKPRCKILVLFPANGQPRRS